jgi:photosystem II stability/assembly factor-like uncharacterized protein
MKRLNPHAIRLALFALLIALPMTPALALSHAPDAAPPAYDQFWRAAVFEGSLYNPPVSSVAFDPATPGRALAAEDSSSGNIWRSTNHGLTWKPLPSWQPATARWSYRVSPGQEPGAFYAWGGNSVYKTTDAGETWANLGYEESNCNTLMSFAAHPITPTVLFAGNWNGLARSLDGGATWESSPPLPGYPGSCSGYGAYGSSIAIGVDKPNVVYIGQNWNDGGVRKSTDLGATWQDAKNGLPPNTGGLNHMVKQVLVDPRNADVAYALMGPSTGQIYRTLNGGVEWQLVEGGATGIGFNTMALEAPAPARGGSYGLYALAKDTLYYLPDGASTWQRVSAPPLVRDGGSIPGRISVDPFFSGWVVADNAHGVTVLVRGLVLLPVLRQ